MAEQRSELTWLRLTEKHVLHVPFLLVQESPDPSCLSAQKELHTPKFRRFCCALG